MLNLKFTEQAYRISVGDANEADLKRFMLMCSVAVFQKCHLVIILAIFENCPGSEKSLLLSPFHDWPTFILSRLSFPTSFPQQYNRKKQAATK